MSHLVGDRRANRRAGPFDFKNCSSRRPLSVGRHELAFGAGIVGRIGPVIDREFDVGIKLETRLLASSTTLVNSTPGDSITRSKPLLYGSAPVPVSRLRCDTITCASGVILSRPSTWYRLL